MKTAFLVALMSCALSASAQPFAVMQKGQARVTLYDEPCALENVSNLKHRATWEEDNKRYEGCFGVFSERAVGAYFDDKQVAVLPVNAFVILQKD